MPNVMDSRQEFDLIYDRNVDTVYRVCYSFMKNKSDAEDMTQEAFLRMLSTDTQFENMRHEKAWLIVTASNLCKDSLKKWWRKTENIENHTNLVGADQTCNAEVMIALMSLNKDYKTAVYMYYYEGYSTAEIAVYMNCPETTVRSRLSRARKQLKTLLGGDAE